MTSSQDTPGFISPARPTPLVWMMAAGCLVIPLLLVPEIYNFADFPKRVAVQLLALFLLIFLLVPRKNDPRRVLIFDRSSMLATTFVLWSFLSLLWAINQHDGLQLTIHWAACAVIFFVAQNSIRTAGNFRLIATALTCTGAVVGLLGISQYIFVLSWIPQKMMPAATFANKNLAAEFIVLVWPLTLYTFIVSPPSRRTWASAGALTAMLVFIIFSTSKGSWVSVGVETLILALWLTKEFRSTGPLLFWSRKKTIIAVTSLLLVISISLAGITLNRSRTTPQQVHSETITAQPDTEPLTSSTIRFILWSNTLAAIKDAPLLGVGAGNFDNVYPLYYSKGRLDPQFGDLYSPRNSHNDYLQITAELGLIGLLIIILFAVTVLATIRSLLASASPQTRIQTILLSTAIAGGGVNALFSFPMQLALPPFLILLYSGVLNGMHAQERQEIPSPWAFAPVVKISLLILVLVATTMLGRYHFRGFKAYAHFFNAVQLTEAKRWPEVQEQGEKALALLPGLGIIHSYIGMAQYNMGQPRQAAISLEKALTFYPNTLVILKNSGIALVASGELKQAVARFIRYNQIKPDVAQIHELLADTFRRMGRIEEALQELLIGADLDPDEGKRYIDVGRIAQQNNHPDLAAHAFAKAISLRPDWGMAHYYYGTSLYALNRKQEGDIHFSKALTLGVSPQAADTIRQWKQ